MSQLTERELNELHTVSQPYAELNSTLQRIAQPLQQLATQVTEFISVTDKGLKQTLAKLEDKLRHYADLFAEIVMSGELHLQARHAKDAQRIDRARDLIYELVADVTALKNHIKA